MRIKLIAILTLLITLYCCEKQPIITPLGVIRFTSEIRNSDGHSQKCMWIEDDRIGIYMYAHGHHLADSSIINNAINRIYSPSSNSLDAEFAPSTDNQTIFFPKSDVEEVNFIAYAPYNASINPFFIPINTRNQRAPRNIDLLYSDNAKQLTRRSEPVEFIFTHKLSKLSFTIRPGFGLSETDLTGLEITISGTYSSATLNLSNGELTDLRETTDITTLSSPDGKTSEAIIIPYHYPKASIRFVATLRDGTSFEVSPSDASFVSGKNYLYELILDRNTSLRTLGCKITEWDVIDRGSLSMNESDKPDSPHSNCYLLPPGGKLLIPVTTASHPLLPQINTTDTVTAELLWTDGNGLSPNAPLSSLSISGEGSSAMLNISAGTTEGNAVVAIKVGNEIKWSWHIWVTNYNPTTDNSSMGNYTFMNRNLGAITDTHTHTQLSATVMGLLYQWGRKDPFTASATWTSPTEYLLRNAYEIVKFSVIDATAISNHLQYAITHPTTFILSTTPSADWFSSTGQGNASLWSLKKTIYDPCPQGWKVPPTNAWFSFAISDNYVPGLSAWKSISDNPPFGLQIVLPVAPLFFPAVGSRSGSTGLLTTTGSAGFYWSCEATSDRAYYLGFSSSTIKPQGNSNGRAFAFNVRCIKE